MGWLGKTVAVAVLLLGLPAGAYVTGVMVAGLDRPLEGDPAPIPAQSAGSRAGAPAEHGHVDAPVSPNDVGAAGLRWGAANDGTTGRPGDRPSAPEPSPSTRPPQAEPEIRADQEAAVHQEGPTAQPGDGTTQAPQETAAPFANDGGSASPEPTPTATPTDGAPDSSESPTPAPEDTATSSP